MKRMIAMLLAALLSLTGVTALAEQSDNVLDYTPLRDLAADNGFYIGGAFGYENMSDAMYMMALKHHFNTVTCTNEMMK